MSTCVTSGERLRQSLSKQTKNEVARRGLDGKEMQKKSLEGLLPGRETPDFLFLTAHEQDESCTVRACRRPRSSRQLWKRKRVRVKS